MDHKEIAARIAAKKAGEPLPEPESESGFDAWWEPDGEHEAELHRERGRRVAAERRVRAVDTQTVAQTAQVLRPERQRRAGAVPREPPCGPSGRRPGGTRHGARRARAVLQPRRGRRVHRPAAAGA